MKKRYQQSTLTVVPEAVVAPAVGVAPVSAAELPVAVRDSVAPAPDPVPVGVEVPEPELSTDP